jgi:hypothetical protein
MEATGRAPVAPGSATAIGRPLLTERVDALYGQATSLESTAKRILDKLIGATPESVEVDKPTGDNVSGTVDRIEGKLQDVSLLLEKIDNGI